MTAQTKALPQVLTMTVAFQVKGSGQNVYTVYRANDGAWVCECQAWKMQPNIPGHDRQCKHTKAAAVALGEAVVGHLNR